jgi:hypothetical protein
MGRGHQPGSPVNATRRWMLVPSLVGALALYACGGGSETEIGTAGCRATATKLRIKAGEPTHEFSTDCLAAPANKPFTITFTNLDESSHGQHNIEIEDAFDLKGRRSTGSASPSPTRSVPSRRAPTSSSARSIPS